MRSTLLAALVPLFAVACVLEEDLPGELSDDVLDDVVIEDILVEPEMPYDARPAADDPELDPELWDDVDETDLEGTLGDDFEIEPDLGVRFCVRSTANTNWPFVVRTARATRCYEGNAIDAARLAAKNAADGRCDDFFYTALEGDQCNSTYTFPTGDKCCDDTGNRILRRERSAGNECGIWPIRWRSHIVTAEASGYCGWECRSSN
ncbi:MAG: hypothetical protein AAF602_30990 [Myxococcota bacterium]